MLKASASAGFRSIHKRSKTVYSIDQISGRTVCARSASPDVQRAAGCRRLVSPAPSGLCHDILRTIRAAEIPSMHLDNPSVWVILGWMIENSVNWISLDYLEFFCQKNQLMIGCRTGEEEVWISALGPHPSSLTSEEIQDILGNSSLFELRNMLHDEEGLIHDTRFLTRHELEQRIRLLSN
ncbi:MAG: hypothetical protein ACE5JX_21115 [Acidobacteriota bacterium]